MPMLPMTTAGTARIAALAGALLAAAPAGAGGDKAKGENVVRSVCTTCHKLPDGAGNAVGPPLAETVPDGGWSADAVADNVNLPHHASAKAQVDGSDYADIAAYLNTFR